MFIIYDFDGVLAETLFEYTKVANAVADVWGYPKVTIEDIKEFFSDSGQIKPLPGWPYNYMYETMNSIYRQTDTMIINNPWLMIYPHVREHIIHMYAMGHTLTICSARGEEPIKAILQHEGLLNYFSAIVGYDTKIRHGFPSKPFPDMAKYIKEICKYKKEDRVVVVGDMYTDMQMAEYIGATSVFITHGLGKLEKVKEVGIDPIVVNDIPELTKALSTLHFESIAFDNAKEIHSRWLDI